MAVGISISALLIGLSNWIVYQASGAMPLPNVTSDMLSKCYDREEFRTLCTENFRGVPDGGRCYFLTPLGAVSNDLWANGWKQCSKYGSTLANLQTEGEFGKVVDHAVGLLGSSMPSNLIMGMKDANKVAVQSGKCCLNLTTTNYWYQDQSTAYMQISPAATWAGRYHMCDDTRTQAYLPRCWVIYRAGSKRRADGMGIGDVPCTSGSTSVANVCQFTTASQTYTRNDSCVAEPPIQSSLVSTSQECADSCTRLNWCRGFNLVGNQSAGTTAKQCQLFTWSIDDKPLTKSDPMCVYYSYVP